jgi:hypothetical protein
MLIVYVNDNIKVIGDLICSLFHLKKAHLVFG